MLIVAICALILVAINAADFVLLFARRRRQIARTREYRKRFDRDGARSMHDREHGAEPANLIEFHEGEAATWEQALTIAASTPANGTGEEVRARIVERLKGAAKEKM